MTSSPLPGRIISFTRCSHLPYAERWAAAGAVGVKWITSQRAPFHLILLGHCEVMFSWKCRNSQGLVGHERVTRASLSGVKRLCEQFCMPKVKWHLYFQGFGGVVSFFLFLNTCCLISYGKNTSWNISTLNFFALKSSARTELECSKKPTHLNNSQFRECHLTRRNLGQPYASCRDATGSFFAWTALD